MFQVQQLMKKYGDPSQLAHSHLTSKNIFINLSDMQVFIGDYGLYGLKKFCKLFHGYDMLSNYCAPEVWMSQFKGKRSDSTKKLYDPKSSFFHDPQVDIYSFGVLLWELETAELPFESESKETVFKLLTKDKVRPRIPLETNKSLALLIRQCWQDNIEKRPSIPKILDSLKMSEFSN